MKKFNKFINSFLFFLFWILLSNYLENYWSIFHWKYVYLQLRYIFDYDFWFEIKDYFFNFDIGYYTEEIFRYLSYEVPYELFKFIPIYLFFKYTWYLRRD